jgi:hypothetical protein
MKLRLMRAQQDQKGIFGGHKGVNFSLNYKLDVSPEEKQLIERYKIAGFIVHKYEAGRSSDGQPWTQDIRVQDLVNGGSLNLRDFGEVIGAEGAIVNGANTLKALIEQMRKFGGEEVIEI